MANENCASHELKYRNRGQAAWELRKGQVFAASSGRHGPNIKPIGKRERRASDARRLCAVAAAPNRNDILVVNRDQHGELGGAKSDRAQSLVIKPTHGPGCRSRPVAPSALIASCYSTKL